jgi:CelD/BcsL family acetyltransferase involved in cellulose biosynthesis
MSRRVSTRLITTREDLDALAPAWAALTAADPSPLVQPSWFTAAAGEALPAGEELRVVALFRGEALAGVAPLVLRPGPGPRWLELLGHQLYEPQGFVAADAEARAALARAVARLGAPLALRRLPEDSPEIEAFAARRRWSPAMIAGATTETATVRLGGPVPLIERMSASRLATFRRKQRQAEKIGAVSIRLEAPSEAGLDSLLNEVFRVESAGWKGRTRTGLLHDRRLGLFYRSYARLAAAAGELRLGFLSIGGETAAVRLDVERGGERFELKIGFDERFAAVSPGQLLTHAMLIDAEARGLAAHHFLGSAAGWQDPWAPDRRRLVTLRRYPLALSGVAALAQDLRRRLRPVPPPLAEAAPA